MKPWSMWCARAAAIMVAFVPAFLGGVLWLQIRNRPPSSAPIEVVCIDVALIALFGGTAYGLWHLHTWAWVIAFGTSLAFALSTALFSEHFWSFYWLIIWLLTLGSREAAERKRRRPQFFDGVIVEPDPRAPS